MTFSHHLQWNGPRRAPTRPAVAPARPDPTAASRFARGWSAVVDYFAPLGYQDESGFHPGVPRAPGAALDRCAVVNRGE